MGFFFSSEQCIWILDKNLGIRDLNLEDLISNFVSVLSFVENFWFLFFLISDDDHTRMGFFIGFLGIQFVLCEIRSLILHQFSSFFFIYNFVGDRKFSIFLLPVLEFR